MTNQDGTDERLTALERQGNYFSRYMQMQALSSAYLAYANRNLQLEARKKSELALSSRPIRVLYYVFLLDQLNYPLVDALQANSEFELQLLAHTPDQVVFLRERGHRAGLIHSKYELHPEYCEPTVLGFDPDIVFAEMPYANLPALEESIRPWMISGNWLPKYTDIFPLSVLNSALFCMVHYGYFIANAWLWLKANPDLNPHYGLPYPNFSWLYFLESEDHLKYAQSADIWGNTSNYVVTGYPKYDVYLKHPVKPKSFTWKYSPDQRQRVVYAPHFARSDAFLERTCTTLLELADTDRFEIVFKPHPNYNRIVDRYAPMFAEHRNTHTVRNGDCSQYIFATADIAIISSVSMHADGLFSGNPYISELSVDNFNHIGREVWEAAYKLDEGSTLNEILTNVLIKRKDPKKEMRETLRARLLPKGGAAVENIILAVLARLGRV